MTIQTYVRDEAGHAGRSVAGIVLLNTTYTNPIETVAGAPLVRALRWPILEPMLFLTRLLEPLAWLDAWRAYLTGWAHVANRIQFGKTVTRSQLDAVTCLGPATRRARWREATKGCSGGMRPARCASSPTPFW